MKTWVVMIPFMFTVKQEVTRQFHSRGITSEMEGLKLVRSGRQLAWDQWSQASCWMTISPSFWPFEFFILGLDFVLVWEVRSRRKRRGKGKSEVSGEEGEAVPTAENSRSERRKAQLAQWREKFVQNLENTGLLMEKVLSVLCLISVSICQAILRAFTSKWTVVTFQVDLCVLLLFLAKFQLYCAGNDGFHVTQQW